eukprot:jgi/Botrbrau1/21643/Bobra.43_1s0045.1
MGWVLDDCLAQDNPSKEVIRTRFRVRTAYPRAHLAGLINVTATASLARATSTLEPFVGGKERTVLVIRFNLVLPSHLASFLQNDSFLNESLQEVESS